MIPFQNQNKVKHVLQAPSLCKGTWCFPPCVQAPRSEALTLLGSLVCFPNTYQKIPLLQSVPEGSEVGTGTEDIKVHNWILSLASTAGVPSLSSILCTDLLSPDSCCVFWKLQQLFSEMSCVNCEWPHSQHAAVRPDSSVPLVVYFFIFVYYS